MRYVDFDSEDLADYPDVYQKVVDREVEPGLIIIEDTIRPIWDVPYNRLVDEFERLGATRLERKAS
ncbi:MAG: hypothetical protein C4534_02905 [Gaiellales bacterium]|nr:MAG: hypothetical protein C4534_02905 [Gaiellales bacterium]